MDALLQVSTRERDDNESLIVIEGELDIASASELLQHIYALPRTRAQRIVVNLTQLRFCDAAGARALLAVHRELTGRANDVVFIAPKKNTVKKILQITGVAHYVPIHASVDTTDHAELADTGKPLQSQKTCEGAFLKNDSGC